MLSTMLPWTVFDRHQFYHLLSTLSVPGPLLAGFFLGPSCVYWVKSSAPYGLSRTRCSAGGQVWQAGRAKLLLQCLVKEEEEGEGMEAEYLPR